VDGCWVDAGFEEFDDLLLHVGGLFATAGHGGGVVFDLGREMGCLSHDLMVPRVSGVRSWSCWLEKVLGFAGEGEGGACLF
jgi:hypothetical protein